MNQDADIFMAKAEESLSGAESEFSNGRYNNAANRCYYACFQAAVHALASQGIQPESGRGAWGHDFVQAQFVGHLINRRKLYPPDVRHVLLETMALRKAADYSDTLVTATRIARMLRRGRVFVQAVRAREERAP